MKSKRPSKNRVLILGYVWPEPRSSAAGLRTLNLVDTFLANHWQVIFASPSKENLYSEQLSARGIEIRSVQANSTDFDAWLKEVQPDWVIFDRFVTEEQFGWRVREQVPEAIRVLDTQDLHFIRRVRERELKMTRDGEGSLESTFKSSFESTYECEDAWREVASILRCDGTLILSDFEKNLLIEQFQVPPNLLFLSRFHYPDPHSKSPSFEARSGFSMIGNFRHPPNVDGLRWCLKEIWPRIHKELPTSKLFVYGAYPPKEIMCLNDSKKGIEMMGPAKDQFEALASHRVNLAPLRFGAGIKGKITDGWWSGTPVVTTPIGAEGMSENLPWGGRIAEEPGEFIRGALELYTDPKAWEVAQSRGYELIRTLYSKEKNSAALIDYLMSLQNRELVGTSLTRRMLNFHSFRGMKYFSKWIEEKNKRCALKN